MSAEKSEADFSTAYFSTGRYREGQQKHQGLMNQKVLALFHGHTLIKELMVRNQDVVRDVHCFLALPKSRFHLLRSVLLWYRGQGPQVLRNEY